MENIPIGLIKVAALVLLIVQILPHTVLSRKLWPTTTSWVIDRLTALFTG
jgi:hypothetical protein